MPTTTFFRLPEEKRRRLEEAAWVEFSTVSFSNASINKIIQSAHIPRGSFYQYFADKEELFRYLLEDICGYFMASLARILEDAGGDLFALPVAAFDSFSAGGASDPGLTRFLGVMKCNSGMDMHWLVGASTVQTPEPIRCRVKGEDKSWVDQVFFLLMAALAYGVMTILKSPERCEEQRAILMKRVEILKLGSLAARGAGVPAPQGGER